MEIIMITIVLMCLVIEISLLILIYFGDLRPSAIEKEQIEEAIRDTLDGKLIWEERDNSWWVAKARRGYPKYRYKWGRRDRLSNHLWPLDHYMLDCSDYTPISSHYLIFKKLTKAIESQKDIIFSKNKVKVGRINKIREV